MKKLLFTLFLFTQVVSAQNIWNVSGTITEASNGETMIGATILVKETSEGSITDLDGNFSLSVPANATLLVQNLGFEPQEYVVKSDGEFISIALKSDAVLLEEFVTVGYGTVKKKDLTGAVSIIDNEAIAKMKPVKVENALQGTVAGVNVTQQSGAPGAGLDIRIRGVSTNGDASPVVIIDGYQGDLSLLNPDDIESITVLKDAQAAIYGTVGANGIVLVTTKKGTKNTAARINFSSSFGWQKTSKTLDLLSADDYEMLLNESYLSNNGTPPSNLINTGYNTDWQGELFDVAPMQTYNIGVSGGTDNITYSIGGSHLDQDGIVGGDKSGFSRSTARINLGIDITKKLKFNTSLIYTNMKRKSISENGLGSVLFNALNMPATLSPTDANGDYTLAPSNLPIEIINPLAQIDNTYNEYFLNKLNGTFGLDYQILESLKATTRIGFNTTNDRSKSFSKEVDYGGGKVFNIPRSSVNEDRNQFNDYTFDAFLTYNKTFDERHTTTATLGTTVYKEWGNHLGATGYDVPYNSWDYANIGISPGVSETKSASSWVYDQRRLSYFGRLQYNYMSKYLVSMMYRRDASTKFGSANRVAYFPSMTAGWVMSEESFWKDKINFINFAKLRMSYGLLGSDKIDNYQYVSQLTGEATYIFDDKFVYGQAIGPNANSAIKWEQSEQFDVGLDLRILDSSVDVTIDYFRKNTNNLLVSNIPVSGILGTEAAGAAGPTVNAGTVLNHGLEFAIGYNHTFENDIFFKVGYNLTTLKNKVSQVDNATEYIKGGEFGVSQLPPSRMEVGMPIGYFYGYQTDGIFQTQAEVDNYYSQAALGYEASPGDFKYVDTDNDGDIDTDDRTFLGSPIPVATMGLNLTMEYKGFDFSAYAYASIGNEMVRNYERQNANVNRMAYTLDRWRGNGTSNTTPRVTTGATTNSLFSDFYVEDASYLRLQNLQLGYTFPKEWVQRIKVDKFRIYAAASNLVTITNYQGYDPAASSGTPIGSGIDYGFYPSATTYSFGLNLNF